jgi:hypothetical protein
VAVGLETFFFDQDLVKPYDSTELFDNPGGYFAVHGFFLGGWI